MDELIYHLSAYTYFGNTLWDYTVAAVVFIVGVLVLKFFQLIVLAKLRVLAKRTQTDFDDTLIDIVSSVRPPLYLLAAVYISIRYLTFHPWLHKAIMIVFLIAIIYEIIQAIEKMVIYGASKYILHHNQRISSAQQAERSSMVNALKIVTRITLWSLGFIFVLSNIGVNVTSLVASLGIGGIAIAFALQNILSDIFSSFSLYFDQPFEVGDFIVAGTESGTVQKIGLKTTRIKTVRGEELVISNKDLTSARLQNMKKMDRRREAFTFGVEYETKTAKLEKIPAILEEIIGAVDHATFGRCHFTSYGDFSLNFEAVYYIDTRDYDVYMDAKQEINLALFKRFEKEKIGFAYPTQKVFLSK